MANKTKPVKSKLKATLELLVLRLIWIGVITCFFIVGEWSFWFLIAYITILLLADAVTSTDLKYAKKEISDLNEKIANLKAEKYKVECNLKINERIIIILKDYTEELERDILNLQAKETNAKKQNFKQSTDEPKPDKPKKGSWQDVLGLPLKPSKEEMLAAFREKVKKYHSDYNKTNLSFDATEKLAQVMQAKKSADFYFKTVKA